MHTIDLLRGQGIPAKTTLGSVAMIVVIVAVPILIAAGMVDRYMQNGIDIESKQQGIEKELVTIEENADAVKFKETLEKEQSAIGSELSEVSSCLGKYIQWSPVLKTLAEYMPAQMVMSELKAEITSEQQKVASENDPQSTVNVTVYKRKLILDISGSERRDYGNEVENYSNRLKSSPVLEPKLEGIEFSQNRGRARDINTDSYTMIFKFKSGSL